MRGHARFLSNKIIKPDFTRFLKFEMLCGDKAGMNRNFLSIIAETDQ